MAGSIAYSLLDSSPFGWWAVVGSHTAAVVVADRRAAMAFDSIASAGPANCTGFVGTDSVLSNRSAVEDDSDSVEVRSVGRMVAVDRQIVADN